MDRDTAAARSCSGESAVWVAWVGPASTAWVRRPSAVSYRTSARAITHYCYNPLSIRHGAMPYSGAPEPARSHRAGRRPARSQHAWAPPGHRMLRTPELPVQHWAHDSCSDSAGRLAGRCMAAWLHGCIPARRALPAGPRRWPRRRGSRPRLDGSPLLSREPIDAPLAQPYGRNHDPLNCTTHDPRLRPTPTPHLRCLLSCTRPRVLPACLPALVAMLPPPSQ